MPVRRYGSDKSRQEMAYWHSFVTAMDSLLYCGNMNVTNHVRKMAYWHSFVTAIGSLSYCGNIKVINHIRKWQVGILLLPPWTLCPIAVI